jgi:large subunit ribosomal protein L1
MVKFTKNRKLALEKINPGSQYKLSEAVNLIKEVTKTKFDASVDIDVRLGVDPRKANQMIRGTVSLPHGTGKDIKVLVLCTPDKESEAKEAGADYVGLDDFIEKIQGGWTDIDVKEVKQGKIDFKVDKFGIIHTSVGKMSLDTQKIIDNTREFLQTVIRLKPTDAKGTYLRSIYLSSTMSPSIRIDAKSLDE